MVNTCVMCGDIIPEGRQVCWKCESGLTKCNGETYYKKQCYKVVDSVRLEKGLEKEY